MSDIIEFYDIDTYGLISSVRSPVRMMEGDLINIRKRTYEVILVTLCVDTDGEKFIRQNVDLEAIDAT